MVSKQLFIEHLAAAQSDAEFLRISTGFATLCAYETVRSDGYDPFEHESSLARIMHDVQSVTAAAGLVRALTATLHALPFWETADAPTRVGRRAVFTGLLMYVQELISAGEWELAEHVCASIAWDTEQDGETWFAAEANLVRGMSARMCAEWDVSQYAYRRATRLAMETGDFAIALRARIGLSNNLWIRGDFPAANRMLTVTARRADELCPSIRPRVTLAMAGVANASGNYSRAIQLAFDLQESLPDDDEIKYQALVDLAMFLTDYGLPPAAEAALRVVEHYSPEPRVRRQATLNRFFLAAHHQSEDTFAELMQRLSSERLNPREKTQFALFAAQGYRRFSQLDAAEACATRAYSLAEKHEMFQLLFESEHELNEIKATRESEAAGHVSEPPATQSGWSTLHRSTTGSRPSSRIRHVADSLVELASRIGES